MVLGADVCDSEHIYILEVPPQANHVIRFRSISGERRQGSGKPNWHGSNCELGGDSSPERNNDSRGSKLHMVLQRAEFLRFGHDAGRSRRGISVAIPDLRELSTSTETSTQSVKSRYPLLWARSGHDILLFSSRRIASMGLPIRALSRAGFELIGARWWAED